MVTKKKLTKEEWEAMTGTDMSFILPSDGGIETALESSLNDTGNREQAKSVEQVEVPFEPQQPSIGKEEAHSLFSASYKQQAEETFSGRIPEDLSSGPENRRPQACVC